MVKPRVSLVVCAYLTAAAGAFAQTSYIFQLPGQTGLTTQIVGKGDDNFGRVVIANNGPSAASGVVATPKGDKFYILAPGGVFSADSALSSLSPVGGIPGGAKVAQVTPDGKYLLVVADQFYIVDTATDSVAAPPNTGVPGGATVISVAASHDGKTAWVLSNSPSGSIVTTVDLTTLHTAVSTLSLLTTSSSMVLSSRNLLYVADSGASVYEIDPLSLTLTTNGHITVPDGIAGPLQFTPDGNTAFFLNRTSCPTCPSFFKLNAQAHAISGYLPANGGTPPALDQILVAGNNRAFAFTSGSNQLWDVTTAPLGLTPTILGAIPTGNVRAMAVSNERPSARYLYLSISDQSFYRVNLATNVVDGSSILDPAGWVILSFVPIPSQSGANSIFQVNPNQNVDPGGSTVLVGQVLDPVGRPVFGVPVSFSANSCIGVTIATPSMVTTSEGWAQTAVTAPAATGGCKVTLTAGSLTADFQLLVGGSNSGGSSQISIYTGDGQLLRQGGDSTFSTQQPLTVRVTDSAGDPLANVSVTFSDPVGPGQVLTHQATTDASGLASTNFSTGTLPVGTHFQTSKVTASSTIGSVEFAVVTHDVASQSALNQPNTEVLTPQDRHLIIPQGGLISGGIRIATRSGTGGGAPIPDVGLRLADSTNFAALSPVVSCQGLSRGDNNGISSCDVVAVCQPNVTLPRLFSAIVSVGEFSSYGLTVEVTESKASMLTPVFPTNNLNGHPGDNFTLIAKVTDGCNNGAVLSDLQWTIQGSATLAQQQTSSDPEGTVKAQVSLGPAAGTVQVQLSGPGVAPIVFNLTTQILVSGLTLVSGGGQTVAVGQAFPNPVVFVARNANGSPVPGVLVNFSASGGTVGSASATTNAQGQVQTTVTAGATAGTIIVTASTTGNVTVTATLSSRLAGPTITTTSFTNAASGAPGLTPCGLATVTGNGVAPNVQGVIAGILFFGQWPTSLAGLSITADGIPVPLHSIANDQYGQRANFQVPCELTAGKNATVVVTVNGATTTASVPVHLVQPGIFSYAGPNNKLYGAVISAVDGSYVTPTNPARRGERYYMVVTGLGLVTPATVTNAAGTGSQDVVLPTIVGLSNNGVAVISARYMAGFIGAYLVEFEIPLDSPIGPDQALAVAAGPFSDGTYVFGNPVFLPGVIAVP